MIMYCIWYRDRTMRLFLVLKKETRTSLCILPLKSWGHQWWRTGQKGNAHGWKGVRTGKGWKRKAWDYCVYKNLRLHSFVIHANPNVMVNMVVGKELYTQGYVVVSLKAECQRVLGWWHVNRHMDETHLHGPPSGWRWYFWGGHRFSSIRNHRPEPCTGNELE